MNRIVDPKVELVSGEYDLSKLRGEKVTIARIEQRWKLRPRQLANYRANYLCRRDRRQK
jgi:hypothetical protein